ncbi:MAG: hypothetical protein AB7F86_17860 [Bdellovibrionales bacterium]
MTLRWTHFFLTLALPFLIAYLVGCIKAKEEKADYGEEVPIEAINGALSKVLGGASIENTALGQSVNYSIVRRLENSEATQTLGAVKVEVIHESSTTAGKVFTLKVTHSTRNLTTGDWEIVAKEEDMEPIPASPASLLIKSGPQAVALAGKEPVKTTFHHLRESDGEIDAPPALKTRPGCGGLSGCKLHLRYVQFDMVNWYADGTNQKIAVDFGFSSEPPYLPFGNGLELWNGLLVLDCRSTVIAVDSRTVYVRDCQGLEDFQK